MNPPGKSKKASSLTTFQCKRCGNCCLGEGYVNIGEEECRRISECLNMTFEEFLETYTIHMDGYERWLIDGHGEDKPCIFLERDDRGFAGCRIENAKPNQCRDFPQKWRREDAKHWCVGLVGEKARKVKRS